jgi:hypothetical protein
MAGKMPGITKEDFMQAVEELRKANMHPPYYWCWGCGWINDPEKHSATCPFGKLLEDIKEHRNRAR